MTFLEVQSVQLGTVFANPVTFLSGSEAPLSGS